MVQTLPYQNKLQFPVSYTYDLPVFEMGTASYTVRSKKGVNSDNHEADLHWRGLSQTEMEDLLSILKAADGVEKFEYTNPNGLESEKKYYLIKRWNVNQIADGSLFEVTTTAKAVLG